MRLLFALNRPHLWFSGVAVLAVQCLLAVVYLLWGNVSSSTHSISNPRQLNSGEAPITAIAGSTTTARAAVKSGDLPVPELASRPSAPPPRMDHEFVGPKQSSDSNASSQQQPKRLTSANAPDQMNPAPAKTFRLPLTAPQNDGQGQSNNQDKISDRDIPPWDDQSSTAPSPELYLGTQSIHQPGQVAVWKSATTNAGQATPAAYTTPTTSATTTANSTAIAQPAPIAGSFSQPAVRTTSGQHSNMETASSPAARRAKARLKGTIQQPPTLSSAP